MATLFDLTFQESQCQLKFTIFVIYLHECGAEFQITLITANVFRQRFSNPTIQGEVERLQFLSFETPELPDLQCCNRTSCSFSRIYYIFRHSEIQPFRVEQSC